MKKMTPKADNRAIAILRVSSHRQEGNTSHDVQEREVQTYAAANGLEIARTARIVESAKDSERRKHYTEALTWALAQDVRHLLFYLPDRESRNLTDNERNEKLVRAGLLTIHYVRDRKRIDSESPDTDFFMRDIHAVTAKQYIRTLSARVKDANREKAAAGWYPGNKLPMGYVHVKARDAEGRELKRGATIGLTPNQRTLAQVRREYELRAEGKSLKAIRERVIGEGFVEPARIRAYFISTLEKRLKHPFYRGEFEYAGKRYKAKHPLAVDPHVVAAVDASFGRKHVRGESRGIFGGGWLTCAECQCWICVDVKRKRLASGESAEYRYYRCTNGKGVHPTLRGITVTEENLWGQFGRALDAITITEALAQAVANELNRTHQQVRVQRKKEAGDYRLALTALEVREDELYRDLKAGVLDDAFYRRQLQAVRRERREYTEALEAANSALDDAYLETAKSILELAKEAKSLWLSRTPLERRGLLETILQNRALDGLTVRYEFRKPFEALVKMRERGDWRPHMDEFRTALLAA